MPLLTVTHPKGQRGTGQGERVDWALGCKWMEEVHGGEEGQPAERSRKRQSCSSNQTSAVHEPQQTSWSQTLRTLQPWRGWYSFLPVGVVWSVCQVEAPLHPSLLLVDVCWRLLLVCLLWMILGGCVHALKCRLQPGQNQGESPLRIQQEVVTANRSNSNLWMSQPRGLGHCSHLALALADSLLLCVLQEPLPDPSVPHIKALLSRLESVSHSLEKADFGSEVTLEEVDQDSILINKVKLIRTYLQQRMTTLCRLIQVQGDFEASVKDMMVGLEGLWAQLEELHTGVTLTKEGGQDHTDLASAQTDAENLFAVLGHYRNRLRCCEAYLKDSTQLLQELTWSHTHISNSVSSSSESVWPELLLQSNIEQFDKVQESFLPLEQQTSTFQAHLEGLEKGNQRGHAGPLAHANGAHSRSASPQTSLHLDSERTSDVEHNNSTSASTSVSSMDADTDTEIDNPRSLCERSALQFTSTIGRLRKSARRK
ncbi:uncharacterized protein si:ch211-151h10.2 [Epinephelus fuscoguttatus]|uniref:uncharacterized protein si:ch211-151h10.2 n=1 Tax=Epinephelus fuscoguttatus TaxID=293821 RepID=UPI0020D17C16|nr:uncharacterized protein si:ch211-151h10.2 [Epinephelus fuscoguttatus]